MPALRKGNSGDEGDKLVLTFLPVKNAKIRIKIYLAIELGFYITKYIHKMFINKRINYIIFMIEAIFLLVCEERRGKICFLLKKFYIYIKQSILPALCGS
ncbi:MAG TPA: hypothetical protein DDW27_00365 [Bacteroidales bacterium]|nr:hypothetical protein [Bacteroidales bacterium]